MSQSSQKTSRNGAARIRSGQIHSGQIRLPGFIRGAHRRVAASSSAISGSPGKGRISRSGRASAWLRCSGVKPMS